MEIVFGRSFCLASCFDVQYIADSVKGTNITYTDLDGIETAHCRKVSF